MTKNKLTYIIHAAIWIAIFMSPLIFINQGDSMNLNIFLIFSVIPLSQFILFYTNYLWLAPKLFTEKEKKYYWLTNIIIIVVMGTAVHCWIEYSHSLFGSEPHVMPVKRHNTSSLFILRDCFNLTITAIIATCIRLAMRWQSLEMAHKEAEAARSKAELKNLRIQINPHFLLNTLNNIYALTAFDTQKAQDAIMELSKLLHHVLYDNQEQYVDIDKETRFLKNYVNLMQIRLTANTDVQMNIKIPENNCIHIAPLIFISLIENAFKHGVSATQDGFIYIDLHADNSCITFSIENSYFPKNEKDRSGHGIGLKQVAKRLQLIYPNAYEWTRNINETKTVYKSTIKIYDTKLYNNR